MLIEIDEPSDSQGNLSVWEHQKESFGILHILIFCTLTVTAIYARKKEKAGKHVKLFFAKRMDVLHFKEELGKVPLFYCRGSWDEEKRKFGDRSLCRMLQKAVAKQDPEEYEPWQKALMCSVGQKCDWTDRAYLEPLLEYIGE